MTCEMDGCSKLWAFRMAGRSRVRRYSNCWIHAFELTPHTFAAQARLSARYPQIACDALPLSAPSTELDARRYARALLYKLPARVQ